MGSDFGAGAAKLGRESDLLFNGRCRVDASGFVCPDTVVLPAGNATLSRTVVDLVESRGGDWVLKDTILARSSPSV